MGLLRGERGATLPLMAVAITLLMGAAAFATDLGWWFLNSARIQRAADAAALAGVIHRPDDDLAFSTARQVALINGYPDDISLGSTVTPEGVDGNYRRLRVTVADEVETFFLKVLGIDAITISKRATAEYVLPLPLGSPSNVLGNETHEDYPGKPNFWVGIQAPRTDKRQGDPLMVDCIQVVDALASTPCVTDNPEKRPAGYYYGVEVLPGTNEVTVEIYDAAHAHRGSPGNETGDYAWPSFGQIGPTTAVFQLHDTDSTPLEHRDNPSIDPLDCISGTGRFELDPDPSPNPHENNWVTICRILSPAPGIYPLQVFTTGDGYASNHFSIRATSPAGPQPKVYGIEYMSIFANLSGSTNFYLAEVEELHRGKTLRVELFDAGDVGGALPFSEISLLMPDGTTAPGCRFRADDGPWANRFPCSIQTTFSDGTKPYDGKWIEIEVPLDPLYECAATCWWTVDYDYSGSPTDRTTWGARIVGNPVHLVLGDT